MGDANAPSSLASVIVPVFNGLEFTRLCIAALARHTRPPWELVVVDNGSSDGTADYLAGAADVAPFPIRVVNNAENRGFPAACNQGMEAARGDHLVLLNNDALVTDGWLDQLAALAYSRPSIGMAGPMSNYVSPPQLVPKVPYSDLEEMHRFASRWREENRGKWFTTAKLSAFCLLLKRTVLESIGGLDESFGPGLFDDDDLALRARRAGFELAVAHDLFVHHFGSRTFAAEGIDVATLLERNRRKFESKWGEVAPRGRTVEIAPWGGKPPSLASSQAHTPSPPRRCRVSLTMIVRDEESNLPACLGSAADLFDEVVVVDTGSSDRTEGIARSFGAKVFAFPWVDNFAAARNAALGYATGDYAFWLDADDRIEPAGRDRLRVLLDGLEAADAAYVVRCSCDAPQGGSTPTVVDHIRLFPLRADVRWSYRVHEQIMPALRRAGVPVRWSDVVVRHVGYADPVVRARKIERDRGLLELELEERPDDPFVLFNLGALAVETGEPRAALVYLRRGLAGSSPRDSIVHKLHELIGRSHQELGELAEGLAACVAGLGLTPDDPELWFRRGMLHRLLGERDEAESSWRRALSLGRPERFSSVDEGIYGHWTRRNLAGLAEERGDLEGAARLWEEVREECPGDSQATAALGRLRVQGQTF